MDKFTPGPWTNTEAASGHTISDAKGKAIADLFIYASPSGWVKGSQQVANARLIASAPCLLKALEEIERMDYEPLSTTDRECFDAVIAKARAAIAAAKGE